MSSQISRTSQSTKAKKTKKPMGDKTVAALATLGVIGLIIVVFALYWGIAAGFLYLGLVVLGGLDLTFWQCLGIGFAVAIVGSLLKNG